MPIILPDNNTKKYYFYHTITNIPTIWLLSIQKSFEAVEKDVNVGTITNLDKIQGYQYYSNILDKKIWLIDGNDNAFDCAYIKSLPSQNTGKISYNKYLNLISKNSGFDIEDIEEKLIIHLLNYEYYPGFPSNLVNSKDLFDDLMIDR